MNIPDELKYTSEHEWVRVEGDDAVVGITDYAQDQLGDIVFLDLPAAGATLKQLDKLRRDRVGEGGRRTCSRRSAARCSR